MTVKYPNFNRLLAATWARIGRFVPDITYLKVRYKLLMGRPLNLENPQTFNEKLNWLKLYDRNAVYPRMVDKFEVKQYVAEVIGKEYIIPTLGVWDSFNEIDFSTLPNQFVLKSTNGGGNNGVVICHDKSKLDIKETRIRIESSMRTNWHYQREWVYYNVKPRIIAEALLSPKERSIDDYKFFCFDGYVDCVMYCFDRSSGDTKFYFFDQNWNLLRYNKRGITAPMDFALPKPKNMKEMFRLASLLSKGFPFLRVDLYNIDGIIYFGETTFYPDSGFDTNLLEETDRYFGELIKLKK